MATSKVTQYLVGASNKSKFPGIQGSQWSCNIYYSKNGTDEYMESVPGMRLLSVIDEGARCRGAYVSTIGLSETSSSEDLFAVFGNTLYRLDKFGNRTVIGNVSPNGRQVSFAETGGPRALMLVADGSSLYYYDLLEGGGLVSIQLPERITSRGGTVTPSHVAVVAGSIVVNDSQSGYCYYSISYPLANENRQMFKMGTDGKPEYEADGVTVRTENVESRLHVFEDDYHVQQYFNTESSSDNINAIYAVGPTLYVFGPKTVEIWQRGSGEFEDWIRTSYTAQNSFGLEAPNSVASSGSIVYFVASGAQYGKAVMMVSGTSFKKISEDWLEHKLLEEKTGSASGFCYSVADHNFFVLQLNSLGETWVYDTLDGGWHQRTSRDRRSGMETQWRAGSVAYYREKFFTFTNDGCMCAFHDDYWSEDFPDGYKLPMVRHRQTAVIVDNLKNFILEELAVECNVGSWDDYELQPKLLLEVSKDGGNTFGNVKSASLGRTGDYSHRVRFHNLGMCRKCVLRITYSHPTEFTLNSCSIRAESTAEMI
jgi:hypothetical protein